MNIAVIKINSVLNKNSEVKWLRSSFGSDNFSNSFFHNHQNNEVMYRYPLIQYKIIDNKIVLLAIDEAIGDLKKTILENDFIRIKDDKYEIERLEIKEYKHNLTATDRYIKYTFQTPWFALQQKNHVTYLGLTPIEKEQFLQKIMIGNVIQLCKNRHQIEKPLHVELDVRETEIIFKEIKHIGFAGSFKINFDLPDYIGLGKSTSRGFGVIIRG